MSTNIFHSRDSISEYHPGTETYIKILHSGMYVWSQQSHMEIDDHLPALLYYHFALQAGV